MIEETDVQGRWGNTLIGASETMSFSSNSSTSTSNRARAMCVFVVTPDKTTSGGPLRCYCQTRFRLDVDKSRKKIVLSVKRVQ